MPFPYVPMTYIKDTACDLKIKITSSVEVI